MRYLAYSVQHAAACGHSPWRIPCLKLPSNFVLKGETPEEKVIKAKSHTVTELKNVIVSDVSSLWECE